MLDTALAHRRHYPAINWFQSYSLYSKEVAGHYRDKVSAEWDALLARCRQVLQQEETLREVAEIVGRGLQDVDRLLMRWPSRSGRNFSAERSATTPSAGVNACVIKGISRPDRAAESGREDADEAMK
jgi:V/A-type H+-transporting ATPase subunit A